MVSPAAKVPVVQESAAPEVALAAVQAFWQVPVVTPSTVVERQSMEAAHSEFMVQVEVKVQIPVVSAQVPTWFSVSEKVAPEQGIEVEQAAHVLLDARQRPVPQVVLPPVVQSVASQTPSMEPVEVVQVYQSPLHPTVAVQGPHMPSVAEAATIQVPE
jgi:hypothetical protein